MSAAEAIWAAGAAGVHLEAEGDELVLAASGEPPSAVLDQLSRHKSQIIRLLRSGAVLATAATEEPDAYLRDHPNDWTSEDLIPATGVGLLIGPTNSGKSFVALDLGHAVTAGRPFFGTTLAARGGAAYLLTHGEAHGFPIRAAAFDGTNPLPLSGIALNALIHGEEISDPLPDDWPDRVSSALAQASRCMDLVHEMPMRLAVVDSLELSCFFPRDKTAAVALMARLHAMALPLGLFVLVVCGKFARAGGRQVLAALEYASDVVLEVTPRAGSRHALKAKRGFRSTFRPLGVFSLEAVLLGQDDRSRPVTTCRVAVSPAPPPTARELLIRRVGLGAGQRRGDRENVADRLTML